MRKLGRFFMRIVAIILVISGFLLSVATVVAIPLSNNYADMISMALGQKTYTTGGASGDTYYESDYDSVEQMADAAQEVSLEVEQEGMVLLQNDNDTLPLTTGMKVTLLGEASVDPVYSGAGAGSIDTSEAGDLKSSMEKAGFEVNPTAWDFYASGDASEYRRETKSTLGTGNMAAHEAPQSVYTDDVYNSFNDYSDAAIVVIGRSGTESFDLDQEYLQFTSEEKDLLAMACERFDTVVVILNCTNVMDLTPIEENDVDAVLWTGAYGENGIDAVGQALAGAINPSGNTVDTWVDDAYSSPASVNQGDYTITNSEVTAGNKYMVYEEGIYVGYRYYETRYEDAVMGTEGVGDYDYDSTVTYPFGYGLSYTDFEWSDYTCDASGDSVNISVTVTNVGDVAGKDTVELYYQSPYTQYDIDNKIEKSSVELAGFQKTEELQPGESQTVTISVDWSDLTCYDAYGFGTYILEAGDYYFTAAENAHAAVNNILAAKGYGTAASGDVASGDATASFVSKSTVAETDSTTYSVSEATGATIENQFEDCDITTYDEDATYLSRSDWEGTWPTVYADGQWEAPEEILSGLELTELGEDVSVEDLSFDTISEEYGELSMADMVGLEFDDPAWDALLSQMSAKETWYLVSHAGYGTAAIESITLPGVTHKDGPAGISSTLAGGSQDCTGYPPAVVLASTWNAELAYLRGQMVGEDSIASGITVWYAPAMNIHRTTLSGRNFEYYSEDSFLSGMMGENEVAGYQSKGGVVTIKHFAINDQETNRVGGAMFFNEQSARELYLVPFQMCVEDANANGVMDAMNRIGTTWAGADEGLMTNVLRNEWGFSGFAITDQASFSSFAYSDIFEGMPAGTDLWLCTAKNMWQLTDDHNTDAYLAAARVAAHRYLYVIANSNAMNGVGDGTTVKNIIPTWQKLYIPIVIVIILIDCFNAWAVKRLWRNKADRIARKERKMAKKAAKKEAKAAKKAAK